VNNSFWVNNVATFEGSNGALLYVAGGGAVAIRNWQKAASVRRYALPNVSVASS
jgi:hypothetical protein